MPCHQPLIIVASKDHPLLNDVAALVDYDCSNTIEQRRIPGGSIDERLTNVFINEVVPMSVSFFHFDSTHWRKISNALSCFTILVFRKAGWGDGVVLLSLSVFTRALHRIRQ